MTSQEKDIQARNRYFVISFARLAGVLMAVMGVVISAGRIEGIAPAIGYVIAVIGLVDMVVVPRMLARKWRTPPQS